MYKQTQEKIKKLELEVILARKKKSKRDLTWGMKMDLVVLKHQLDHIAVEQNIKNHIFYYIWEQFSNDDEYRKWLNK